MTMSQVTQVTPSRSRAPNFTSEDQELLLEILKPYTHIIECKKTDNVKLSQKSQAWSKITSEYNAKTKNVSRNVDNLVSCYRNMKSKLKKQHSEAKRNIKDPNDKEELVNGSTVNREDLATLAKNVNKYVDLCKAGLRDLEREYKNYEIHKEKIMSIDGGPSVYKDYNALKKLKPEPQEDGLDDFQDSLSDDDQMKLVIDIKSEHDESEAEDIIPEVEINVMPSTPITPMTNVLPIIYNQQRKREEPIPSSRTDEASKRNEPFKCLTEAKRELVNLQMELVSMEIKHKKKLQELELEDVIKENKFKDELRQKKLRLLDLEIKKMTE